MSGERGPSTADSLYRSVANQRRRLILTYLQEITNETATLDELVDYVVQQEANSPAPDRESVTLDLYHLHLPLLADEGIIEFDARTERVQYASHPEIERILDGRSCLATE